MSKDVIEEVDGEVVESMEVFPISGVVGQIDRAQIDIQIATAKRYPRSIDKAMKEAITLATVDEETAKGMNYLLPRKTQDGKKIQGPTARLAEIMTYAWGNLRAEADIVDIDGQFATAMGTCFDLERNIAIRVRVKRRITDKEGRRYSDDMIQMTCNAGISIALRNAVFKVIPRAYVNRVYEKAKQTALGEAASFKSKRDGAIKWFEEQGLKKAQLFDLLGVRGIDDVGGDQLIEMFGLQTAIKDGDTTIAQLINRSRGESDGAADLNAAPSPKPKEPENKASNQTAPKDAPKPAGGGKSDNAFA